MGRRVSTLWLVAGLGVIGLTDVVRVQMPPRPEAPEAALAPPPELLLTLTLGHRRLAADIAWLDATSYYGGRDGAMARYARLASTLDNVVTLDPEFRYAYLFGGLALNTSMEGVEAADALLRRGAAQFPSDWRFPYHLGVNAMLFREDHGLAAEHFSAAGRLDGAPPYLFPLALRLAASSGNCQQSLEWIALLEQQTRDPVMRRQLDERRRHVVWECNFQLLEAATAHFAQRRGRAPSSVQELVDSGLLPGLPVDPWGGSWGLDAQARVTSTTRRKRLRVQLPPNAREDMFQW